MFSNNKIEKIYLFIIKCYLNMFLFLKKINNLLTKANDPSDKFKDLAKFDEGKFNKLIIDKILNSNARRFSF